MTNQYQFLTNSNKKNTIIIAMQITLFRLTSHYLCVSLIVSFFFIQNLFILLQTNFYQNRISY